MIGKIAAWIPGRGFGFIERGDGGADLFVHCRDFADQTHDSLPIGARVQFEIKKDERNAKLRAVNVARLDGANGVARPSPREAAQAHFRDA